MMAYWFSFAKALPVSLHMGNAGGIIHVRPGVSVNCFDRSGICHGVDSWIPDSRLNFLLTTSPIIDKWIMRWADFVTFVDMLEESDPELPSHPISTAAWCLNQFRHVPNSGQS